MAVGPLKVLRKAPEPPARRLRRIPKTLKLTNHLRRRDGRAFILRSAVGTQQPINAQFRTCHMALKACVGVRAFILRAHRADRRRVLPKAAPRPPRPAERARV